MTRFHAFLQRHRTAIMWLFIGHLILLHEVWLGFTSWDGFTHRVPPIVELIQNGSFGSEKSLFWALQGFRPFIELIHAPFLYLFGLPGLYYSFAVVAFPACIGAVYLFVKEMTQDRDCGLYGAACYALVPMVNEQVFSGYVDFAVTGSLAFFLYAVLRLRRPGNTALTPVVLGLATWLLSMSRQQAPYLCIFFFGAVAAVTFLRRPDGHIRLVDGRKLAMAALALAIGIAPAAARQIASLLELGNPIYPYELSIWGIQLGKGVPYRDICAQGGMTEYSVAGFLTSFVHGWLWPPQLPSGFFDSRFLGGGLLVPLSAVVLPFVWRDLSRLAVALIGAFLGLSFALRDFWHPRFAYTLVLATTLLIGTALGKFVKAKRKAPYWIVLALMSVQLLRPEWAGWRMASGEYYMRMDLAGSRHFVDGMGVVDVYPDLGAKLVVVDHVSSDFLLPLYGRRLSNRIVGSLSVKALGPRCEGLVRFGSDVLFVDDNNHAQACPRECAIPGRGRCLAFRLKP